MINYNNLKKLGLGLLVAGAVMGYYTPWKSKNHDKLNLQNNLSLELIESYGKEFDCTVIKQGDKAYILGTVGRELVFRELERAWIIKSNGEKTLRVKVKSLRFSTGVLPATQDLEFRVRIGE